MTLGKTRLYPVGKRQEPCRYAVRIGLLMGCLFGSLLTFEYYKVFTVYARLKRSV